MLQGTTPLIHYINKAIATIGSPRSLFPKARIAQVLVSVEGRLHHSSNEAATDAGVVKPSRPRRTEKVSPMSAVASEASSSPLPGISTELLRDRFTALWRRSLLPGAASDPDRVWRAVERHYEEAHRHYHDKEHLVHCLQQLDMAAEQIDHPDRVEMAIWFHDVINEPERTDNESRSAEMFRDCAQGVMLEELVEAVVDLILVTTHRETPGNTDGQFVCDIDLASFGCPWECYLRDTQRVKAEFKGPVEDYYRGKRAFLESMLARPRIFQTDFFNRRYEGQARENIQRLLELLERRQD